MSETPVHWDMISTSTIHSNPPLSCRKLPRAQAKKTIETKETEKMEEKKCHKAKVHEGTESILLTHVYWISDISLVFTTVVRQRGGTGRG